MTREFRYNGEPVTRSELIDYIGGRAYDYVMKVADRELYGLGWDYHDIVLNQEDDVIIYDDLSEAERESIYEDIEVGLRNGEEYEEYEEHSYY